MRRDDRVVFLGEDVAAAGGVFKATVGLLEEFGPQRVRDTPISEQAILGAAMGAAMTGLRPVAEIMFSDFFAVCWDLIANEIAKSRYMSDGQVSFPLVIRTANGAGVRFGAQHSQSVENWAMAVPGLKVVAPSNPHDVIGLLAAAIRDPDPVLFFEQKSLYATKGEVGGHGEIVEPLGRAKVLTEGGDATILALAAMVPRALAAASRLSAEHGIGCSVVDVRSLVPLDTRTILAEVAKTGRLFTVEENPRLCGWGAEIVSIAAEEAFGVAAGTGGADHHAAHPAARRRRPGGPRAALGDADHRNRAQDIGGRVTADLASLTGIEVPTGLLIGGEWRPGSAGTLGVTDPATEDTLVEIANGTPEDAIAAVAAAHEALPALGRHATARARGMPAPGLGPDDRAVRGHRAADGAGERQGAARRPGRGRLRRRVLPLVRRGGGPDRRRGDDRPLGGQPDPGAAAAGRGQRPGHAVELPGRHGHPQDRARRWRRAARSCSSRPRRRR